MKFKINLFGVKDYNAGVVIDAEDRSEADEKAALLARYEESHGGIAIWESDLDEVHSVAVQGVEEVGEDDETDEIDWDEIRSELDDDEEEDEE